MARPAISLATLATSGVVIRQGPHHGAQKSTSTGTRASLVMASKSSVPTSRGLSAGPRPFLHFPHFAVSWSRPAGTRFSWPQCGHVLSMMGQGVSAAGAAQALAADEASQGVGETRVLLVDEVAAGEGHDLVL